MFARKILLCLVISFYSTVFSIKHATSHAYNQDYCVPVSISESSKTHQPKENLQTLAAEYCKNNNIEYKDQIKVKDGLVLIEPKSDLYTIAIIDTPKISQIYKLSEEEKRKTKDLFKILATHDCGGYHVLFFKSKEGILPPQNAAEASFLLYSPYVIDGIYEHSYTHTENPLSEQKKAIIYNDQCKRAAVLYASLQEGILESIRLKTDTGHRAIRDIKVGDTVVSRDTKSGEESLCKITHVEKDHLPKHVQITINDELVRVGLQHKFHVPSTDRWVSAQDLKDNPELCKLVDSNIKEAKEVDQELEVIRICVEGKHNFYITDYNILVHNFFAPVIVFETLVTAAHAILKPLVCATIAGFVYLAKNCSDKKNNHRFIDQSKVAIASENLPLNVSNPYVGSLPGERINIKASNSEVQSPLCYGVGDSRIQELKNHLISNQKAETQKNSHSNIASIQPPNPDKDPERYRRKWEKMTTKQATEAAEKLGFRKVKGFSKKQPVYTNGRWFISPDAVGHRGGTWKIADSINGLKAKTTRLFTGDDLLRFIGK